MYLKGKLILRVTLSVAVFAGAAQGQARLTADRSAEISVFAGGSYVDTDYGNNQKGYLFGADYTRFLRRFYVDPSIEVRASLSPKGEAVGEDVYSGGLKVERRFARFVPYADVLMGYGKINFTHPAIFPTGPYTSDSSIVVTYGGGVDVDLVRHFGAKVDFQASHWNTGENNTLSPSQLSIGVVYRIPFRPRYR